MDPIILLLFIIIVAVVAVVIIDKTFTGPMADFAWVAKIVVGLIALAALYYKVWPMLG